MYSLTDQIRRSSRSIGANLAEAWQKRRYEANFISKLSDADAELSETQHWIDTRYRPILQLHRFSMPSQSEIEMPKYRPNARRHNEKPHTLLPPILKMKPIRHLPSVLCPLSSVIRCPSSVIEVTV